MTDEPSLLAKKTVDIRVNLVVGAALVLQSATAFMWAGAAQERLTQLERRVETREQFFERTARLEEQVTSIRATVNRIERKLDRPEETPQ